MEFKATSTSDKLNLNSSQEDIDGKPKLKSRGPHGVGDPDDQTLRKVEIEVMVPIKMREKGKEMCSKEVQAFNECCKNSSIAMVVSCRSQNSALKTCLTKWYNNEDFKKQCTEEYLAERTEYRSTGIKKKAKKYEA